MGHYGHLFCFARVFPEHVKDIESLIKKECLIDDLNLEPKIGYCNIFANTGDLDMYINKDYPKFLNDAIILLNKLQCISKRLYSATDNINVFYSPHFHTLIFQCSGKDCKSFFDFHRIADVLFDSYILFSEFEGEDPCVDSKNIPLDKSLSKEYFNCDLETFLGQPDFNLYYTGESATVLPSYNGRNPLGAKQIQDKLNGYQPIVGNNCYVKSDGYLIVF